MKRVIDFADVNVISEINFQRDQTILHWIGQFAANIFSILSHKKIQFAEYLNFGRWSTCIIICLVISQPVFSQHVSKNNYTGNWESSLSWSPAWVEPQTDIIGYEITINGYITSNEPLSFSDAGSALVVNDTLVIEGDLNLGNETYVIINSGGIIIIKGNLIIGNKTNILVNFDAYLIVSGNFTKNGFIDNGQIISNNDPSNVFIGGTVNPAAITDNVLNFPVFNCSSSTNPYPSSSCNYGDITDMLNSPISIFFQTINCEVTITGCPDTLCVNETIELTGDPGGGIFTILSGPGFIVNDTLKTNGEGIIHLQYVNSLECIDTAQNSIIVLVYPIADPGSGGNVCGLEFNLNATLSSGTGAWTKTTGTGTAGFDKDANDPTATVTVSEYGSYTFTWTETNGPCSDDSTITVTFYESPVADPGAGGEVCGLEFTLNATLSSGTGTWTKTTGTGTAGFDTDANDPTATVTVSEYGSYTFTWTEINGPCSDDSTITVNFYKPPIANPGAVGNVCGLEYTLNATLSSGTGTWTKTTGTGTAGFDTDANDPGAIVTVSEFGSYTFTWTEINGPCSDDSTITITFYEPPIANPGAGGNVCGLEFTLNATLSSGTGTWTKTTGTGTAGFDT
ncbi:MAG: hypothetical protein JXJ22_12045, partial [Bacteroidales bacterium]|nr:hypothetical protein [Bacteroidales bacterium]